MLQKYKLHIDKADRQIESNNLCGLAQRLDRKTGDRRIIEY
jgi:hypothetical protein